MSMLADVCVGTSDQKYQQSLLRQRGYILRQLQVADPLRRPYWTTQLLSLKPVQSSAS